MASRRQIAGCLFLSSAVVHVTRLGTGIEFVCAFKPKDPQSTVEGRESPLVKRTTPRSTTYQDDFRLESCRFDVCSLPMPRSAVFQPSQSLINHFPPNSYNRYLAVASQTVRRSLKSDIRAKLTNRGQAELKFAKWEVSRFRYIGSMPVGLL